METTHAREQTEAAGQQQVEMWNGHGGRGWVEAQDLLDRVFAPFEAVLLQPDVIAPGSHVLDVGCGTGSTAVAAARLVGADGRSTGIDISLPMITAARARAHRTGSLARFVHDDAQTYAFEPASVDTIVSRFGVLFFADPVLAFANLRGAGRHGARLRFLAWRSAGENPFMTTAERAAGRLLPHLSPRRPDEPGQFAFGDRQRVSGVLQQSGWSQIEIQPVDLACTFPEPELDRYLTWLGPVGRAVQQLDERTRREVVATVRKAFAPYVQGADIRFVAGCWVVEARARP